jgi:hypothetical protein
VLVKCVQYYDADGELAKSLRASSSRALASASDTSGYFPNACIFSLPPKDNEAANISNR